MMSDDSGKEMELNESSIQILMKKSNYYFSNHIPVHITYNTGQWANGYIKEFISDGFILEEFKKGSTVIFFLEISTNNGIEPYIKPEDKVKEEYGKPNK